MVSTALKSVKGVSLAIIIVAVVGLIISAAIFFIFNNLQSKVSVIIGDGAYEAQLATTPETREKGLAGVTNLSENKALLMIFPGDDNWKIWMKDMKVPIDIVWLNKDKRVVHIVRNASPDEGTDVVYTPTVKARYVLELPAGSVDNMVIRSGTTAIFSVDEAGVK